MRLLRPLALLAFFAAAPGCVSSGRYDDAKEQNVQLKWQLEAAEKAASKSESEKRLAQRETELARKDARVLHEQLANEGTRLKLVRTEMDDELKRRLAELQEKAPGKHEVSIYGGVVLETGILFASGHHELTKEGEKALGPISETLAGPRFDGYLIEIAGHTDSDPLRHTAKRYDDNHDLSAKRANSVRRFLAAHGVPGERVYCSAWGSTHPLASETDKDGKASNRRVEIQLHKQGNQPMPAAAAKSDAAPATDGLPLAKPEEDDHASAPAAKDEGDGVKAAEMPAGMKPGMEAKPGTGATPESKPGS